MESRDTVEAVDVFTVALPIPKPLQLGAQRITRRTYAVVRIRTREGLVGWAYGLSRDAPIAATVSNLLAPLVVGGATEPVEDVWETMYRATAFAGRVGVVMRAISLVDIALWDIRGKRAGEPIWRLLGAAGSAADCVYVAGYPTGDPPELLGERVAARGRDGHRLLKVARMAEPQDMKTLLRVAGNGVPEGTQVIVDAAWWWKSASEASTEIAIWRDETPLAWIEDPIVPEDIDSYRSLSTENVAPIGVGDELTDRFVARSLMTTAGIDVLRIEATSIGGITGARWTQNLAKSLSVPVSFHIYPETHVHLAAGSDALVETFGPRDNPWDPAAMLYANGPHFAPGRASASDAPGLGIEIDEDLVQSHLV